MYDGTSENLLTLWDGMVMANENCWSKGHRLLLCDMGGAIWMDEGES